MAQSDGVTAAWKPPWRRRVLAAVAALALTVAVTAGDAAQRCRVPKLVGLTVANARMVAARAGCRVRVVGPLTVTPGLHVGGTGLARLVTVARQAPRAGRRGDVIVLHVVPVCAQSGAPGGPPGEPFLTPGPTELISGLFLAGGPLAIRPVPCRLGVPSPGTITVRDPATGAVVATGTAAGGRGPRGLATIPLAPGTYSVTGTFGNAWVNGVPIQSLPLTVTIPAGVTVRQDVSRDIP